ncbi:MAG: rod shape-determining protein MreC [Anaerolineales bacterium]|nr:MAG: rod shape-determining protein MreC [Anaerolineales bacterium]
MSEPRTRWLAVGVVGALLLLGLALGQLGYLQPARNATRALLVPFQAGLTTIGTDISNLVRSARDLRFLRQHNAELQAEVNRLSVENARLTEVERENERLRQLLNFTRSNPWYDYKAAAVVGQRIGEDPSNLLFSIFVDVGARDGVAIDMPVITDRGLVGRVVAVGPNVAGVLLLIDPASAVNARVQNSRVTGIVRGNIDGGLVMERIPQGETISPGDIVLTSGLGGNFPDKLVIGQITEVLQRDSDLFQSARVRPTVDFGKLEEVMVIVTFATNFEGELQSPLGEEGTD